MKRWLLLLWLSLPVWAFAQTDTIEVIPIERVVIQEIPNHISRVNHEPLNLPYMVASILQQKFSDLQAQQSLQEGLKGSWKTIYLATDPTSQLCSPYTVKYQIVKLCRNDTCKLFTNINETFRWIIKPFN